ncbi:immunoglobulin-like domain-containing protein [Thermococcus sp. 9N3]|uniref:immunoglobulin-like domain-containing protein n=1 Tax=Thermococcus sp. 9N3 TaxID=163002 RepID=UPI0014312885|nr:immunoglobulin-like domain-containing protein [Thermococcus sp. 9N3]
MVSVKRAVLAVLIIVGLVAGYFLIGSNSSAEASQGKKAPINLSLDRERYSPTDTMVLTVTNNGNETVTVGYPFELYREENGKWVKVNVDLMFIQSVVQLEPGKSWTQKVSLSQLKLSSGHYKIVKKVSTQQMTLTVSAEFYIEG